jgi:hypothetical protein
MLMMCSTSRADDVTPERLPVPNSTKQAVALKQIKEQYKSEYAKKAAADRLALSKTFQQLALNSSGDSNRKYVLLREARELAVDSGDFDQALAVIDEIAKSYAIEGNELKVSALTAAMDKASIPPTELMNNYLRVADQSLENNDVLLAAQASMLATKIAVALKDPTLKARAKEAELRVHDARRELNQIVAAANKLKNKPDDPDANLLVGQYLCFVQGSWEHGLPHLAKGSDKGLADMAAKDQDDPSDPTGMVALGDGWWDLADTKQTPQKQSRRRAVYWYEQALPKLAQDKKPRVEQRIAESKLPVASPSTAVH